MTNARQDAFYLMLLGSVFFALVGFATQRISYLGMIDFKEFYSGARCLIEHHDPYSENELGAVYQGTGRRPALRPHHCSTGSAPMPLSLPTSPPRFSSSLPSPFCRGSLRRCHLDRSSPRQLYSRRFPHVEISAPNSRRACRAG